MTTVRPYDERDHDAVLALADRLTSGRPPWRNLDRWLATARGWVAESIAAADSPMHALHVAVVDDVVVGFVALSTRTHFTGDVDAYVGELVVAPGRERQGIGRALLAVAESWAREHGLVSLTLDTGAVNTVARRVYASAGFVEEDVRLTKRLDVP
ncbi:MAG: GNAT family N-acetyltransferase [Nocardioidaceae bacterium]